MTFFPFIRKSIFKDRKHNFGRKWPHVRPVSSPSFCVRLDGAADIHPRQFWFPSPTLFLHRLAPHRWWFFFFSRSLSFCFLCSKWDLFVFPFSFVSENSCTAQSGFCWQFSTSIVCSSTSTLFFFFFSIRVFFPLSSLYNTGLRPGRACVTTRCRNELPREDVFPCAWGGSFERVNVSLVFLCTIVNLDFYPQWGRDGAKFAQLFCGKKKFNLLPKRKTEYSYEPEEGWKSGFRRVPQASRKIS